MAISTAFSGQQTTRFEKIFNPVNGKTLAQRPTLAKIRLEPLYFSYNYTLNPYDLLLCYFDNNLEKILEIITDESSFLKSELKANKVLSQTLPTHHVLPPVTVSSPQETEELDDAIDT